MKSPKMFSKIKNSILSHKFITTLVVLALAGGGYYAYSSAKKASVGTQYVMTQARIGTLTQTITGSGQVSAENQLDLKSEVSGDIISIPVKVGDSVRTGEIIASVDPHDALIALENARISLAKLVEPAKPRDIQAAQNTVDKAYSDSVATISNTFLDLPDVLNGLNDLFYSRDGFLGDSNVSLLSDTARTYRDEAGRSYDTANRSYLSIVMSYKSLLASSNKQSISKLLTDTIDTSNKLAEALRNTQNAITFIIKNQPEYHTSSASGVSTDITTWSTSINSNITSLVSNRNSIKSSENTLTDLQEGSDSLDIQTQRIALSEKEHTYSKYFIRAPFDGIIGRIPVNIHDTASNGTVIATIASANKMTIVALNEVDAVKVNSGQRVTLTFDAISGLTINGTVVSVDQVGVATQGVVTYNIKISFNESDPRIKPGMSTDATIITAEKTDTLLVPSSAIKTQGQQKYVEIFDPSVIAQLRSQNGGTNNSFASSSLARTRRNSLASSTDVTASTSEMYRLANESTTTPNGQRNFASSTSNNIARTFTITSLTAPTKIMVTVGESNDTSSEVLSGLNPGQFVVTRTMTGTAVSSQASTPSLFGNIGGSQRNVTRPATTR